MTVQKLLQNDDEETVLIDGNYEDMSEIQRDLDQELDAIFSEFGGDDLSMNIKFASIDPSQAKATLVIYSRVCRQNCRFWINYAMNTAAVILR